jgi:hypothetical protein
MGTRKVKLSGLGYWAKIFEGNRDLTGFEDALKDVGGQCTIDVDLDAESFAKLQKSKTMLRGKQSPDNEGMTRVRFKRKWIENYGGGAPTVVKADGSVWDYDEDGFIGNGSTVEVILNVYDTTRKNIIGTRLEKVKVLEHLEYVKDDEDEDEEPAPKPVAKAAAKPQPKPVVEDDEDDIPF